MDILSELSALRRADAAVAAMAHPQTELEREVAALPPARDFRAAFGKPGLRVIGELKKASPSEGVIRADYHPVEIARDYVAHGVAAISVLCEPHRFLGNEADLRAVRAVVDVPILYKDFITTEYQVLTARAAGADAVLLIAAVLDDASLRHLLDFAHATGLAALVETHAVEEIERALAAGARVIGVNCRDLRTFRTDPAITANLIARLPSSVTRIAESGLKTHADLVHLKAAGADGFLIGTTLMRETAPGMKLSELINNHQ